MTRDGLTSRKHLAHRCSHARPACDISVLRAENRHLQARMDALAAQLASLAADQMAAEEPDEGPQMRLVWSAP